MLLAVGTIDRNEVAVVVEIVLDEAAGREVRRDAGAGREHPDDLVRVRGAEPCGAQHLLPVLGERPDRLVGRRPLAAPGSHRRAPVNSSTGRASSSPSGIRTRSTIFCRPAARSEGLRRTRQVAPVLCAGR